MKKYIIISLLIITQIITYSQVINIPNDYPGIQKGIEAAMNGDTVLVDTGTYNENIDFLDKNITVASNYLYQKDSSYIFNTVIDGSNPANLDFGSVVTIAGGQDTSSILYGFTITGGSGFYVAGATPYRVGGGIVTNSGCKIESNIITDNHCINDDPDGLASGGGISAGPAGTENYIIIKNNLIYNNSAWANGTASSWDLGLGQGGGIYLAYSGLIEGNIIHSNWCKSTHSYSAGGGVRLQTMIPNTPLVKVKSNIIYNNESISPDATGFGGGLCCSITNSIIESNRLSDNKVSALYSLGGAIYFDLSGGAFSRVVNNHFMGNTCTGDDSYGGGIGMYAAQEVQLINNLIAENSAKYGAGVYVKESQPKIVNNTISKNIAQDDGGGLYFFDVSSEAYIVNTIFWNDSAAGQVNEISTSNPDNIEIVYSRITDNWNGEGNIDDDPQLFFTGDQPYNLADYSPCIDAGSSDTTDLMLKPWDIMGNFRLWDGNDDSDTIIDMGAYEYDAPLWTSVDENELAYSSKSMFVATYPNPFTISTTLSFRLSKPENVHFTVYNVQSQIVFEMQERQGKGEQQLKWNAEGLPAGMYYYRIQAGNKIGGGKMVKMR